MGGWWKEKKEATVYGELDIGVLQGVRTFCSGVLIIELVEVEVVVLVHPKKKVSHWIYINN